MNEKRIKRAWKKLNMPKLDQMQIVKEHGFWVVMGYDHNDDRVTYAVESASGFGEGWLHYDGIGFERLG